MHELAHMGRRTRFNGSCRQLEKIEWQGLNLVPVKKDFWSSNIHPCVAERTYAQSERMRLDNAILILDADGWDVPQPVDDFSDIPFPDWALDRMRTTKVALRRFVFPISRRFSKRPGVATVMSPRRPTSLLPCSPRAMPPRNPVTLLATNQVMDISDISSDWDANIRSALHSL